MKFNMLNALITRKSRQQKLAKALTIISPHGIVEGCLLHIGGIDQWITIREEDRQNPVLFFVDGTSIFCQSRGRVASIECLRERSPEMQEARRCFKEVRNL